MLLTPPLLIIAMLLVAALLPKRKLTPEQFADRIFLEPKNHTAGMTLPPSHWPMNDWQFCSKVSSASIC